MIFDVVYIFYDVFCDLRFFMIFYMIFNVFLMSFEVLIPCAHMFEQFQGSPQKQIIFSPSDSYY